MKLINADALKENHSQWGGAYWNVIADIDNAPAVEAITTEWLKAKAEELKSKRYDMCASAVQYTLSLWEAEKNEKPEAHSNLL